MRAYDYMSDAQYVKDEVTAERKAIAHERAETCSFCPAHITCDNNCAAWQRINERKRRIDDLLGVGY